MFELIFTRDIYTENIMFSILVNIKHKKYIKCLIVTSIMIDINHIHGFGILYDLISVNY